MDEEDRNPDNVSCDLKYGLYNSNTMQINSLHHALVTFETQTVNGTKLRKGSRSGDTCRWIPTFSAEERDQVVAATREAETTLTRQRVTGETARSAADRLRGLQVFFSALDAGFAAFTDGKPLDPMTLATVIALPTARRGG